VGNTHGYDTIRLYFFIKYGKQANTVPVMNKTKKLESRLFKKFAFVVMTWSTMEKF
jgi:hypothetical protein